jgi:hypothetical protein
VEKSSVADAPFEFEARLQRAMPHLRRLKVMVPEKHDLVLMKAMRGYEHDLQVIAEIHAHSPLDLDTLIRRYQEAMTPIGDPARIRGNLLAVVERLFPESVEQAARRLPGGRP